MHLFRRLLRWSGFALALSGVWLVAFIGVALLPHLWFVITRPPSDAQIVARAVKLPTPPYRDSGRVVDVLRNLPGASLRLFTNPNPEVRSAALRLVGYGLRPAFNDEQSDTLVALLPNSPADDRWSTFTALGDDPRTRLRLANLLASPQPIEANLRKELIGHITNRGVPEGGTAGLHQRLLAIAADAAFDPDNRRAAVEALGRTGPSAEGCIPELEKLAIAEPAVFGRTVAIAISRLRDTPDLERLRADLDLARQEFWIEGTITKIAKFGPAAHGIGPELVKELQPFRNDAGQAAADALGAIGYREAIPELRTALRCQWDERLVRAAAFALVQLGAKEAAPDLAQLAQTHWEPSVRLVAGKAASFLTQIERYNASVPDFQLVIRDEWTRCLDAEHQAARRFATTHPVSAASQALYHLRVAWTQLISPRFSSVIRRYPDKTEEHHPWRMLPRHRMRFGDGVLLGYDEGEFGAGVVFVTAKGEAYELPTPNVERFIRWNDSVIVATDHAMFSDPMLYRIHLGADGHPIIEPFMRPPTFTREISVDESGGLIMESPVCGVVRVAPDGTVGVVKPPAEIH